MDAVLISRARQKRAWGFQQETLAEIVLISQDARVCSDTKKMIWNAIFFRVSLKDHPSPHQGRSRPVTIKLQAFNVPNLTGLIKKKPEIYLNRQAPK